MPQYTHREQDCINSMSNLIYSLTLRDYHDVCLLKIGLYYYTIGFIVVFVERFMIEIEKHYEFSHDVLTDLYAESSCVDFPAR